MRRTILLFAATTLMLAMVAAPASATPPVPAEGSWTWTNTSWNQVDLPSGGARISGTEYAIWTGTFAGSSIESFKGTIMPDGTLTALIRIEFTGSVNGAEGGLSIQLTVWAKSLVEPMGGRWTIRGGTGGLADLHGQGTWTFTGCDTEGVWCWAYYSGQVHFAP